MNNIGSKQLETNRLVLKAQTMDEQKYLWTLLINPMVNKYYLIGPEILKETINDWNIQEKFYLNKMKHSNDLDNYSWSIFLKENNKCIGMITCGEINKFEKDVRDIGWYLDPLYQGKGYCTEAAKKMIDFMFRDVNISKIITSAAIQNRASWRVMEKLNFIRLDETKMIKYLFLDEEVENYQYVLTKEMYLKGITNDQ